jgi:1,2-phenylacetyl-CoA epoxidase catalytic subunit
MKRLYLICLAVLCTLAPAGCLFSKKNPQPKENPAIASEVEANFKQRWVNKRTAELKAAGMPAAAAQAQAEDEFNARYSYTSAAKK